MTFRFKFILLLFFCSLTLFSQNLDELKKSKKEIEEKIQLTNALLNKNRKNKSASVHQLELMRNKIILQEEMVKKLNLEISGLDHNIESINAEVIALENDLERIKKEYGDLIYTSWKMTKAGKELHYILAGYDLQMVYRRFRYILDFNSYKKRQAEEIVETQKSLASKREELVTTRDEKKETITEKNQQLSSLNNTSADKQKVVNELYSEEKKLKKSLSQQRQKAKELERFIQEIIEKEIAEARKKNENNLGNTPEQQIIGDDFSKNYSRLPWPVEKGIITLGYGPYTAPGQQKVTLNSNGIEISSSAGSYARSVFKGTVVGVYALPGYNTGVIIKHGNYFSFYANLESVSVKPGEEIQIKQKLGKIFVDPATGSSILHFEIYKDKLHVNPQLWLSK